MPWTVELPEGASSRDESFVFVRDGHRELIHLHDYARIYTVPGLYERVVQDLLQCRSPTVAVDGTITAAAALGRAMATLRVLDLGAGVGLVGELLRAAGVSAVVGLDNLAEARDACLRDRPGVYEDYLVADLERAAPAVIERLTEGQFEVLTCVGALGGGHIPPGALIRALNTLTGEAMLVMTVHERWLDLDSVDPFSSAFRAMTAGGYLEVLHDSSFTHRLDMSGDPIMFRLLIARRAAPVPVDLI
ncbi:class I SAM-dependent methyltransferase [Dactylosporangium sp. NPDC051485]|uniref:class I SAM-dependent methyltransferase n=1 Tax=Dactylosporangium sp. NPDC051485 TaxID=3154846 RepID=UPI0034362739